MFAIVSALHSINFQLRANFTSASDHRSAASQMRSYAQEEDGADPAVGNIDSSPESETSNPFEPYNAPLRYAINNWRRAWQERHTSPAFPIFHADELKDLDQFAPDDVWKRTGFIRHAPEYWLLARVVVERQAKLAAASGASRKGKEKGAGKIGGLLMKFDETSMEQVNSLMKWFQRNRYHVWDG